ncbi:uncharacterized protein LOC110434844 [Sorghum bicolor]|uniref:uncharacterized protein LOC110434844 n=1 Tax=Sorghum bicolor TaxID=4558 RepID=UPI000B426984|nr:uncharacterized protein LOC110434844 [Sorghum bicolor]|eukprot:XP_021315272.1 uncharacterized protein LOC110434844 [Sorghum bicolor]
MAAALDEPGGTPRSARTAGSAAVVNGMESATPRGRRPSAAGAAARKWIDSRSPTRTASSWKNTDVGVLGVGVAVAAPPPRVAARGRGISRGGRGAAAQGRGISRGGESDWRREVSFGWRGARFPFACVGLIAVSQLRKRTDGTK